METSNGWLAELALTLGSRFGSGLTLFRDGNSVGWSYAGQAALVALEPEGTVAATFVDAAIENAPSEGGASCVYRRSLGSRYSLTGEGCSRMVDDMSAFFAGTREPDFTFVGIRPV